MLMTPNSPVNTQSGDTEFFLPSLRSNKCLQFFGVEMGLMNWISEYCFLKIFIKF